MGKRERSERKAFHYFPLLILAVIAAANWQCVSMCTWITTLHTMSHTREGNSNRMDLNVRIDLVEWTEWIKLFDSVEWVPFEWIWPIQ